MLRTVGDRPSLWESMLPEACLGMPAELEAVGRLLDDSRLFEPYRRFFPATRGRPSIPMETCLRVMFLKYRDTAVVEAKVAYQSDSGLLAQGVARIAATAKKWRAMGLATRTRLVDGTRAARQRARSINADLRRAPTRNWSKETDQRGAGRRRRTGRPPGRGGGAHRPPPAAPPR
ncbi:MAG TPA: hypothetical protein VKD67_02650 [Acidimicrobiales bacterium]|nr:hypothetical protein [Acidimicrobiales bacterium]